MEQRRAEMAVTSAKWRVSLDVRDRCLLETPSGLCRCLAVSSTRREKGKGERGVGRMLSRSSLFALNQCQSCHRCCSPVNSFRESWVHTVYSS